MKKLRITQVKSGIGQNIRQKRTLEALGMKRMHQVREVEASPQVMGMIQKVKHLLTVEEI